MTEHDIQLCESPWCTVTFEAHEGFGGRCPECLAIADEHHAYGHAAVLDTCTECHRLPSLGSVRRQLRSANAA